MNAKKERLGREEALQLAEEASNIYVAKGKKVVHFNMKKDPPSDDDLAKHLLGPTGNLRAPTIRVGKKLIVGFNQEMYEEQFE